MARTKRIYNRSNRLHIFHPYAEICCGNCKRCKDWKFTRRKKTKKRKELKFEFGIF